MPTLQFIWNNREVNIHFDDPSIAGALTAAVVRQFDQETTHDVRRVMGVYSIPSNSHPGTVHPVLHYGNAILVCDCEGYQVRKYCSHQQKALAKLRAESDAPTMGVDSDG